MGTNFILTRDLFMQLGSLELPWWKEWVAIHRKHHTKCELFQNPHNSQIYSIGTVLAEISNLHARNPIGLQDAPALEAVKKSEQPWGRRSIPARC